MLRINYCLKTFRLCNIHSSIQGRTHVLWLRWFRHRGGIRTSHFSRFHPLPSSL